MRKRGAHTISNISNSIFNAMGVSIVGNLVGFLESEIEPTMSQVQTLWSKYQKVATTLLLTQPYFPMAAKCFRIKGPE
jgi:hypothetical protein